MEPLLVSWYAVFNVGVCLTGVVAVSVAEQYTYNARIDNAAKVIMTPSLILIWSFTDPIHPQVHPLMRQGSIHTEGKRKQKHQRKISLSIVVKAHSHESKMEASL